MARGTSILILEDENSYVHSTILKVFLSEGVNNEEKVMAVAKEEAGVDVYGTGASSEKSVDGRMVIAWKYSSLSLRKPKFKFNLSRRRAFEGTLVSGENASLEGILSAAEKEHGLRIVMFSLLSPVWDHLEYNDSEVIEFLARLKRLVRLNNHVCMISVPGFLRSNINFNLYFDTVMSLDSHVFTNFCPNYNGILEFKKIVEYGGPRVNSLDGLKYGIKIKKENVCVEKIDVPPEDVVSTEACAASESF